MIDIEKKKFVFATQEADPRKTRFDKKAEKNKKESRRAGEEESGKQGEAYSCKCCGKAGGHPKFFPASQAGRSRTSLARCPKFKAHEDKLALIKSLKACKMCLSTTHTHDKCLLDPSTPWLLHECGDSSSKDHNPVACPFKPTTPENSNKVSDEKNFKSKKTRSLLEPSLRRNGSQRRDSHPGRKSTSHQFKMNSKSFSTIIRIYF